jgi:SH3 domain-containing protein 19
MTIPSRPAPAPPATQNSNTRFSSQQPSRYTPTTNWDDSPFDAGMQATNQAQQSTFNRVKKPPPPRPPPPKINQSLPAPKKPPQSVNILSNLFGSSKSKQQSTITSVANPVSNNQRGGRLQNFIQPKVPPKLPAPPPTNHHHHNRYQAMGATQPQLVPPPQQTENVQLISFDSPPDSPTLTQKSNANSDCVSIDSFSSDSNYSSPHNESASASQAESGFEDDFSVQSSRSNSGGGFKASPWEVSGDPFSQPPAQPVKTPKVQPMPKSMSVGGSSFFSTFDSGRSSTASRHQTDEFLDPLCNGRTLIKTAPVITRPTIIKPKILTAKPGAGARSQAVGTNVSVSFYFL